MPDEVMSFIQRDTYSFLIKGLAGTGKTTLALTILRALGNKKNFFYISTRISPTQLFQYYPWLDKFAQQHSSASPEEGPDNGPIPSFEDARLDEPESLFERVTTQLMDIKSPIIIIDSWDAIASFMDKEARLNNERVLQTWRERAGAKLIFISEHPDDTTLDFLVDGIVELKQSYYESIRVREIFLLKLRGIRIERASYIYTLNNSIFRSFTPYRPVKFMPEPRKKIAADQKIATTNHVRSGYATLDGSLGGGFPRKGVILLELDSHVNTSVAMAFLQKLISNFVSAGNLVLFQPFDWMDPHVIMNYLGPSITSDNKSLFKILWTRRIADMSNHVVSPDKKRQSEPSIAAIVAMKQKNPGKLLLNIMGTDIMQRLYGKEVIKSRMESLLSEVRTHADLSIAVISHSQRDVLEYLSEVSDMHLRILMINGTLLLQSLVPASTLHSVVFDGYEINLEPIV
jgi:KaiC/GvpD/RAD55 family RecA-like ATPase